MMAAGLGAPASSRSSRRNSAVGALPMATTAPDSRSIHKSSAAAERVVESFVASSGTRGSFSVQMTVVARRQTRSHDAARDHFGIAEDRRAGGERIARRADEIVGDDDVRRQFNDAAGVDHAHRDIRFVGGKAHQVGLGADDGE